MPWNPLSERGLWSRPLEVHRTQMGAVAAMLVIALDRRGYHRLATVVYTLGLIVALISWIDGRFEKPWYATVPLALIAGVYLAVASSGR